MNAITVTTGFITGALIANAVWNAAAYIATHHRRRTP